MASSAYDKVFDYINNKTPIEMRGDHEEFGQSFEFRDRNGIKVGEVNFDNHDEFLGGTWYGAVVVSGRALSKRLALNVFLQKIEDTYGG